jgi:UDP-galactopyranose mutase
MADKSPHAPCREIHATATRRHPVEVAVNQRYFNDKAEDELPVNPFLSGFQSVSTVRGGRLTSQIAFKTGRVIDGCRSSRRGQ